MSTVAELAQRVAQLEAMLGLPGAICSDAGSQAPLEGSGASQQLAEENKLLKVQLAKAQYRAAFLARNLQAMRDASKQ